MKSLKTGLTRLLVILTLMLPWATTEALETFNIAGVITQIGYDKFTVLGQRYRVSPGARVGSKAANRKKFSDFKKGDKILFQGKILNGVRYVDLIRYIVPDLS